LNLPSPSPLTPTVSHESREERSREHFSPGTEACSSLPTKKGFFSRLFARQRSQSEAREVPGARSEEKVREEEEGGEGADQVEEFVSPEEEEGRQEGRGGSMDRERLDSFHSQEGDRGGVG
jgi:hypothetical protein